MLFNKFWIFEVLSRCSQTSFSLVHILSCPEIKVQREWTDMTSAAVILKAFPKVQSREQDMLLRQQNFEVFQKLREERKQTSWGVLRFWAERNSFGHEDVVCTFFERRGKGADRHEVGRAVFESCQRTEQRARHKVGVRYFEGFEKLPEERGQTFCQVLQFWAERNHFGHERLPALFWTKRQRDGQTLYILYWDFGSFPKARAEADRH